jgi:long-chain acyl-CoA synthetase
MNLTTTVPVPVSVAPATDVAYILPTGGTTGTPKAVALSHQNMVANAWQQYRWTRNSFGKETMLAVLPFFHSYGMSATVMGGAMMGASLVLHHRFNTRQVIRLIEQESPSVFHAVPAMLVAMNERLRQHPAKLESIRWVISGGAPLEPQVGTEFAQHSGALVVEGYGLSETSPVTHVGDLFGEPQYGTIGYPLPETECRIVSVAEPHDDVLPGESGELCIKGPQVMLGYWRDPEGTREALRDGWLHTGDLAICEPSGRYRIVGRKKDLIITSGFNVYPIEVENVLREHPAVQDVAVVGVPDASRGELVKAFVVLKPNERWDELSLRQHCERRLAKYKRPRLFVRQHGDLPRNFLGKVIRRELRASPTSMTANSDTKEYAR